MTRFLIVDAQSVKNTDSAAHKGFDAGNKVSGIKRHIAVDTQGLPHAVAVTTADVTDRQAQPVAYVYRDTSTLGGGALVCLAGEVSATLEELRAQAQY